MKITQEMFEAAILDARNGTKAFYDVAGDGAYEAMIKEQQEIILSVCVSRNLSPLVAIFAIAKENKLSGAGCSRIFAAYVEMRDSSQKEEIE